ncbi:unnamed protein product [Durusdinium trenchii]|uniref:Uncharacterized protein n=1 Tax=Durusdinium trenchii TaxID=1381693 RepID=A0ABP0L1N0_9DINO
MATVPDASPLPMKEPASTKPVEPAVVRASTKGFEEASYPVKGELSMTPMKVGKCHDLQNVFGQWFCKACHWESKSMEGMTREMLKKMHEKVQALKALQLQKRQMEAAQAVAAKAMAGASTVPPTTAPCFDTDETQPLISPNAATCKKLCFEEAEPKEATAMALAESVPEKPLVEKAEGPLMETHMEAVDVGKEALAEPVVIPSPELEAGQDFKPPPLPEKPACLRKLRPDPISPARKIAKKEDDSASEDHEDKEEEEEEEDSSVEAVEDKCEDKRGSRQKKKEEATSSSMVETGKGKDKHGNVERASSSNKSAKSAEKPSSSNKRKPKKNEEEEGVEPEAKTTKAKRVGKEPEGSKKSKRKAVPGGEEHGDVKEDSREDKKKKYSRKSAAYHRAVKMAREEGVDENEAKQRGKAAACEMERLAMVCVLREAPNAFNLVGEYDYFKVYKSSFYMAHYGQLCPKPSIFWSTSFDMMKLMVLADDPTREELRKAWVEARVV